MDLSIVLPVYNVEPYLKECLDSIFEKKLENIELIAVNDGSTDGSLNILMDYSFKQKNMIVINQKNAGPSVARNVGLNNSSGKYVYFFDSDDILTDGIYLFESIKNCCDADIITFDADIFDNDIKNGIQNSPTYREPFDFNKEAQIINGTGTISLKGFEYLKQIHKRNEYISVVWRRIYKRHFLTENRIIFFPGVNHAEDDLHFFQTLLLNPKVIHFQKNLVFHRIRRTSLMGTLKSTESYKSFNIILTELLIFKKNAIDPHVKGVMIWIINIFLRRIHTQKPNFKEVLRLVKLSYKNEIPVSWKTILKFLINLVRKTNFE